MSNISNDNRKNNLISESELMDILRESLFDTITKKLDDFQRGYKIPEGNPKSLEDVFRGNGWEIKATSNGKTPNSTMYAVYRKTGQNGVFNGLQPEELTVDLNVFLQGKGKAIYVGKHPKYPYIEVFKIQF